MKKLKLIALMAGLFTMSTLNAQQEEIKKIEKVIQAFAKAGDENNAVDLERCLAADYRIVMNRLFGSSEVSIMPKSLYLEKIASKEYGGDNRKLTIENIVVNGTTASAKVTMVGTKMTFVSLIILIQDENGNWKLISETPIVKM